MPEVMIYRSREDLQKDKMGVIMGACKRRCKKLRYEVLVDLFYQFVYIKWL